ncbi:dihydrodipicolinate synthase family protein, partial [Candidatus Latescibacterota bacterium]
MEIEEKKRYGDVSRRNFVKVMGSGIAGTAAILDGLIGEKAEAKTISVYSKPTAKLCGMYPILPTPFHDDETFDFKSMKKLIDYLIAEGVDGVVTLANASEGHLLSDSEKERLAAEVIRLVDGRVPTIISATHFSSRVAAKKAKWAENEGADALLTLPPFFGSWRANVKLIKDHLRRINDSVSIPIILQDHPLTGISLSAGDLCGLITEIPG